MQLLGAKVVSVTSGSATLKDAINDAMRAWVSRVDDSHYCLGSVMGPHPFPYMVREFQRVVGDEAREQFRSLKSTDPDYVVACVGGGSNALGTFVGFVDTSSKLIGVEAAGEGIETIKHGAAIAKGSEGIVHGMKTVVLQDSDGQIQEAHSISAGLDYPGVGPEHAHLANIGRAQYVSATDDDALYGFAACSQLEGIIPALESAHAIGWLLRNGKDVCEKGSSVVVTMSGRGDKDVYAINADHKDTVMKYVAEIEQRRNA
jgi:tryptophan synthase beta chain